MKSKQLCLRLMLSEGDKRSWSLHKAMVSAAAVAAALFVKVVISGGMSVYRPRVLEIDCEWWW